MPACLEKIYFDERNNEHILVFALMGFCAVLDGVACIFLRTNLRGHCPKFIIKHVVFAFKDE